jgi:hypothetical protein
MASVSDIHIIEDQFTYQLEKLVGVYPSMWQL